ncbi:Acyl transferase/acyl hydrolase/lysophospholipase [Cordyceps fumosorosea ARSEF 2679]|uniref:Acyl transferase/acyl hydrolase/lysophospholipase n=1 Tax=Cordyceps fumosorosea (strain ARSEF 2679) TaxID=1081104 RepID=A0A166VSK8_CORFA|nr:Acyl transferase/acyl hydrolase/lysophospholipase [Cordyceps fumosorosea ARSEF 2679]OAA33989.1 Acyl transferase/acyl hydrolase/lysophospholipase [Cordyceps fumosorosea ARSEF 2679]
MYEDVAEQIFQPQHNIPLLSSLLSLFHCPIYGGQAAENAFREAYGSEAALLDPSFATGIGTRVVLPVATVPDPSLLAFTNYNAVGDAKMRLDYRVHEDCGDVAIADLARGCTAAPTFFSPVRLEGLGEKVQDPGIIENNAIALAQAEVNAYYGSSKACQFLLNIGTGSRGVLPEPTLRRGGLVQSLVDWFLDSAINRIGAAYSRLLSGTPSWAKYVRGMDPGSWLRDRCIRLDLGFDAELRLDDVGAMAKLKARAEADPTLRAAVGDVARRCTAALFYFELDGMPRQAGCVFSATGTILCRCERGEPALPLLVDKLSHEGAKFVLNDRILDMRLLSAWSITGGFAMPVRLQLTSAEFRLSIRWPDGVTYPISGSPFSLRRLVKEQGLDAPFGLAVPGYTPRRVPSVAVNVRASPGRRCAKRQQEEPTHHVNKRQRCR